MSRGEGQGNDPTHAVANDDRPAKLEPPAQPRHVVSEALHAVWRLRLVALAVATEIHRHHASSTAEVLDLRDEVGVIAGPSVNEDQRRLAVTGHFKCQGHIATTQLLHGALHGGPCDV